MEADNTPSYPLTIEEIFNDYSARRLAIITALTLDVNKFLEECDPAKDDMCLYGYPDEKWKLEFPSKSVPAQIPEPTTGINFVRDTTNRKDWLCTIAIHSDCWLLSVAFFYAALLNSGERRRLFILINSLSSIYEAVRDFPHENFNPGVASGSTSWVTLHKMQASSNAQLASTSTAAAEEEDKGNCCGICGGNGVNGDEFWILCEMCNVWYHGWCVLITPSMAECIDKYECPECTAKKIRH